MRSPAGTAVRATADPATRRRIGGAAVATVYAAAATVLVATGTTRIRYSADHERTIDVWEIWIPVAAALLVARLAPPRLPPHPPEPTADRPRREALACVAIAAGFAAAAIALQGWVIPLKIVLLAVAPTLVLSHQAWLTGFPQRDAYRRWWWAGPAVATATWLGLAWAGPYARPSTDQATLIALLAGFVVNAYIEERFYRGWLQTRLEHVYGRWTAIGAASLLWAVWHLSLHSTGRPLIDIATVVAHHGVLGLLLGYLWSRYRNPWPLLLIHAAVNTPLALLTTVG